MKIRNGFVSNSSSCSFCIYGASFNSEEVKNVFKSEILNDYEFQGYLEQELEKIGLNLLTGPDWDNDWHIGKSWTSMKDDQTKREFKEEVENKIKDKFGSEVECKTIERAWYDG